MAEGCTSRQSKSGNGSSHGWWPLPSSTASCHQQPEPSFALPVRAARPTLAQAGGASPSANGADGCSPRMRQGNAGTVRAHAATGHGNGAAPNAEQRADSRSVRRAAVGSPVLAMMHATARMHADSEPIDSDRETRDSARVFPFMSPHLAAWAALSNSCSCLGG
jgi:hypothetical protein